MQFHSYAYVFAFLPITWVVYLILRETRFANWFLTAASLFFYAYLAVWYLVPLMISAVLDYFVGQKIGDSDSPVARKRWLMVSLIANLGMLAAFKYLGWITGELSTLLAMMGIGFPVVALALPPGISFYTFQTLSYTIDIAKGEFKPRRNFIDYMSFVSFFPQLVAGPIERAIDLLPQIEKIRPRVPVAVVNGAFFLILFGLFQKTVLADGFASIVEFAERTIAKDGSMPAGMGLLFTYGFAFQIYCDFAAYSMIARGTARLFGIELQRNFLTPYMSSSPSEFWTRWHISLSSWLRDYLYIPLGGNRGGTWLTLRNLMITMTLGGLWHGAGILFLVWGVYHGLLLAVYRIFPIDQFLIGRFGRVGKLLSMFIFFHLVCIGWIFFRANVTTIGPIWASILATPSMLTDTIAAYSVYFGKVPILGLIKGILSGVMTRNWYVSVGGYIFLLIWIPLMISDVIGWRRKCEMADLFPIWNPVVKVVSVVVLFYAIVFFGARDASEFIYFQF
jgi:alginate O-acetyltransferase complex protein AlgI